MEADAANQVTPLPEPTGVPVLKSVWQWVRRGAAAVRKRRRLRVCESLSLGERRFIALIEFDHQEFLVGGSGNSLELLARLHEGTVITEPPAARASQIFETR